MNLFNLRGVRSGACLLPLFMIFLTATPLFAQSELVADRARQALNEGRFAEAVTILNQGIAQTPGNAELLLLRGQAQEARGRHADAAQDYETALRLYPGLASAQSGLERTRRATEATPTDATEAYRRLVEANPGNVTYRLQYADALREAGRLAEAVTQYEAYLLRTQGTPDVVTRYLITLAGIGQHARGATEAQRYLNLYPSSSDLWMRLGYFRLWQGDNTGAEAAFRSALDRNPRNQDAQRGLAEARGEAGRPVAQTQRVDRILQSLSVNPNQPELRFELVEELVRLNRHVEAFSELQTLEAEHGESSRWISLFRRVDAALPEQAEVFRVDRLTYRLALDPTNLQNRYTLVEALAATDRYAEAHAVLAVGGRYAGAGDATHQAWIQRLQEERLAHAREQQEAMYGRLSVDPDDHDAARHLAATYPVLQAEGELRSELDEVADLYERLLAERPDDREVRFQYAQLLTQGGDYRRAIPQSRTLLDLDPTDPQYVAQYVYAAIQAKPVPVDAEVILLEALEAHPYDPGLLLAAVTFYTSTSYDIHSNIDQADYYLTRAENVGADARDIAARRDNIRQARNYHILADARADAEAGRYLDAIAGFDVYHRATNTRPDAAVKTELGYYYEAAGLVDEALWLFEDAQEESFSEDTQLTIARIRFDNREYERTLYDLEPVLIRRPGDTRALLLYGDALRELQRYDEAEQVYRQALVDPTGYGDATDRIDFLHRISGPGTGFGLLVIPRFEFAWGKADVIEYRELAPGVGLQFTTPSIPDVTFTADYQAHFIRGTDYTRPEIASLVPEYTTHQLGAGVIVDLTPRIRTLGYTANYTNRLILQGGAFIYPRFTNAITGIDQKRTGAFWNARYQHQTEGVFRLGAGIRGTEAASALWAAVAPSIEMRLLRADIQVEAFPLDSLLKVEAGLGYNRVTHIDLINQNNGEDIVNNGITANAKLGYRVGQGLYFGGIYNLIRYEEFSLFYFAPHDPAYQLVEAFLEYETPSRGQEPYFRALGAVGTVLQSGGYLAPRIELDLIYPFARNVGLGAHLRAGHSSRYFAEDLPSDGYTSISGGVSLYIGL